MQEFWVLMKKLQENKSCHLSFFRTWNCSWDGFSCSSQVKCTGVSSLQTILYNWLLVFVICGLCGTRFCHVWLEHVFATCGLPIISSLPLWLHTLLRWLFLTLRENSLMPWTKLAMAWDFSPHLIFRLRDPRSHRPWRDKYPPHRFFLRAVAQQRHPVHRYQTNYFSKTFTFLFGSEVTELIHRIWSICKPSLKWLEVE